MNANDLTILNLLNLLDEKEKVEQWWWGMGMVEVRPKRHRDYVALKELAKETRVSGRSGRGTILFLFA